MFSTLVGLLNVKIKTRFNQLKMPVNQILSTTKLQNNKYRYNRDLLLLTIPILNYSLKYLLQTSISFIKIVTKFNCSVDK